MSKRTNTNSASPVQMFAQATQLAFHNSSFNAAGRDINYYTVFNDDEKMIHKWLGAPDSSINLCTALDKKTSGTGNWIFHDPQYIHWMKQGGMLWIQGKAGSGKTILLSTLIESLQTDPQKLVAYHYFDTRDTTGAKSSYQGLLASILQQLGSSNSRIHPALKVLHQSSKTGLMYAKPSNKSMENAIKTIINDLQSEGPVCVVLDALDECNENNSLQKFCTNLVSDMRNLWLAVTSRHLPDIHWGARILISLDIENTSGDIDVYLATKIAEDFQDFKSEPFKVEVKKALKTKAEGVFRWIDCQLNILKECKTSKAARRAMQNLPLDLQGTYEQAVQKCKNGPNSTEAYHILLWLLYAFEPLDQKQITAILSIDLEEQVVESSDEIAFKIENIVDSTLVAINSDGVVQLAHASVKEFLLLKQVAIQMNASFDMDAHLAHDTLAQMCIVYLLQWKDGEVLEQDFPFESYAIQHWAGHATLSLQGDQLGNVLRDLSHEILKASSFQYHHWTENYKLQTFLYDTKKGMNPFWWAACLGLLPAINDITLLDKDLLNQPTGDLGTPLSAAAYFERENSVHFLLHIGANVNAQGGKLGNALQAAACCGNVNMVKCLFESGANVNAQGGLFGNALEAASWNDHRDVVEYLLKNGADANDQGGEYGNALVAAAYEGNEIIVKLLVAHGADVNIQVEFFLGNALQTAAYEGYESIVQYLLLNGADINAEGGEYGSALKAAASKGHENIFIYLLDNGANFDAHSRQYEHVLQSAIRRGNERIVKRFLDDGADVNTQGGYHGNALQTAVFWGHETMVKQFLENGAEVNVSDGPYGNILRSVEYAYNGRNEKMIQILVEFGAM
ncbi:ankyrin repeat-containing domain protein [Lentinula lateritia]|uniref:Ankyrin repeat-containing domain protein n=1 Tax=Lentinula lateritia TaxID=40482 RepID=A0ABQ8V6Z3_9AGAR|nr:ankyrin repeat-containing domain protein [Lentinula lateritia]